MFSCIPIMFPCIPIIFSCLLGLAMFSCIAAMFSCKPAIFPCVPAMFPCSLNLVNAKMVARFCKIVYGQLLSDFENNFELSTKDNK